MSCYQFDGNMLHNHASVAAQIDPDTWHLQGCEVTTRWPEKSLWLPSESLCLPTAWTCCPESKRSMQQACSPWTDVSATAAHHAAACLLSCDPSRAGSSFSRLHHPSCHASSCTYLPAKGCQPMLSRAQQWHQLLALLLPFYVLASCAGILVPPCAFSY